MRQRLGTILLIISLGLMLYGFKDSIKSFIIRQEVENTVSVNLEEALGAYEPNNKNNHETEWIYKNTHHEPILDRKDNNREYATKGAFIIPKIDKHIAVMDGTGGNNMFRGAGEQYLDQKMGIGNYVLSSHRMYDGKLFARLHEVSVGDEVYLTDYEKVYKYEVFESDNNVETTRTELLQDTKESIITFYGCTPDGVMRVVKQAKLVGYSNIEDLSEADKEIIREK